MADLREHGSAPAHGGDVTAASSATVVGTAPIERTEAGELLEPEHELLTVNMGPHHPATHGVLRLLISLQGEEVLDLKPVVGYVHTGIEKSCEAHSYWKVIPFVERMDYLSYFFNMQAFCGAVETLLELEIPPRAKYLRMIHLELNRLHSHLFWLGTSALDLGAISMLWYALRERDTILDMFEMAAGQRMHTRYFQVGGVFEDIPVGFEQKLRSFCDEMPGRVSQYEALLDRNEIFLRRTRGVGIVPRQRLLELGVTGPLLRAAGEPWDLRKAQPDLAYDAVEFKIPVGTVGDAYDRYRVRMQEMRESVRIIEQCLDGLPEGPWIADDRKVVLPPRDELSTSMEALIHHFKLVTEGFRVPPGEIYCSIESPRGELGCYVLADGSAKPARVHFRDPSFVNLQSLREMAVGGYVADLITNLGMLDPILGVWTGEGGLIVDPADIRQPAHLLEPTDDLTAAERRELIASMRPTDAAGVPELHEVGIPDQLREEIESAMSHYPQLRSASIPALWAVQRHYGWCSPEGIRQAAAVMGVTPGYLQSVASFYDLFATEPIGRQRVLVCRNISCWMNGADELLEAFCAATGADPGDANDHGASSPDGEFFVTGFECLGACDIAPMASIDERYYGPLDAADALAAIEALRAGAEVLPGKAMSERPAAGGPEPDPDPRVAAVETPDAEGRRPGASS